MRKYFFIVLLMARVAQRAAYSGGNGTGLDPYLVATARDLADLTVDQDNWSRYFRQIADIDMSDLPTPLTSTIGNEELPFSGVFDGDGRIIRNLVCTNPGGDTAGLFGQVRGSDTRIQNVVMVDPNVEAEGAQYVGIAALVGRLRSGRVTCCRIEDACVRGYSSVGALVGWNQGEVSHCEATGTVSGIYPWAVSSGRPSGAWTSTIAGPRSPSRGSIAWVASSAIALWLLSRGAHPAATSKAVTTSAGSPAPARAAFSTTAMPSAPSPAPPVSADCSARIRGPVIAAPAPIRRS